MAGLYLHIPFCKQACHYCNFHFSTSLKQKPAMVQAILRELELRQAYLENKPLSSIYFGGGTPSLLDAAELDAIFNRIGALFSIAEGAEITLEANPDDLTADKLQSLRQTPVNRLSIGIQSFAEADLQFMNRAHNAREAKACIENALALGFENLTVDLIYGSPTTSDAQWIENIETVVHYGIPHVSCYALTVEERTALAHFVKTGKAPALDEEHAARQFEILTAMLADAGYEHYEISNFAKPGWHARHNSSYWFGEPYLGVGPAAHSFDGRQTRQWNIPNNALYIRALTEAEPLLELPRQIFEQEILTPTQRYNEYVMTSLRTMWGVQMPQLQTFGLEFEQHFLKTVQDFIAKGWVIQRADAFILTMEGKLLADFIAAELFKDA
ncbi:MAG: radical SAM family heme chaperone HemW [Saprospiraceae bacterium]